MEKLRNNRDGQWSHDQWRSSGPKSYPFQGKLSFTCNPYLHVTNSKCHLSNNLSHSETTLVLFPCEAWLECQRDERQECLPSHLPASIASHVTDGPGHGRASILPQCPACTPWTPGSFPFWDIIHLPSASWAWLSLPQNKGPPFLHNSFKIAQDTYCAPSSHLPPAPSAENTLLSLFASQKKCCLPYISPQTLPLHYSIFSFLGAATVYSSQQPSC